jgi:archaemetzincin
VSLTFTSWGKSPKSKAGTNSRRPRDVKAVALSTGAEAIRIRVRSTPPPGSGSSDAFPYSQQLNLDDMTDVALSVLPSDAYALLLLTTHDTYESEDDDFCCGRAWGASRVAIVSSARYQPSLDDAHGVDRGHIWPASHCSDFVDKMNIGGSQDDEPRHERNGAKRRRTGRQPASGAQSFVVSSPLEKAVDAHRTSSPAAGLSVLDISSMFLFRLCRTASHELGHCFGLDHCMYKACVMQGTASVAEDMRQPPYLCSVCEAKVAWAIVRGDTSGAKAELETRSRATRATRATERAGTKHLAQTEDNKREIQLAKWKRDKYEAMKTFCEQVSGGAFAPLLAWSAALQ